ncbi:MAG: pyrimidine 5-nucleotidase [Paucimonas sp.]|nr:pyrimidine 5-nucleotidase [Paucimonas sp.]
MPRARLTWLFDLDNTLHDASHAIFPAINVNMNAYMAGVLGVDGQAASPELVNATRIAYWKRYGATLLGMVRHHRVDAADFLQQAHRFDDLGSMIRFERGLARTLARLPGRKILLTNAPSRYAREVIKHLNLQRQFRHQLAIEAMTVHRQLRPKPSRVLLHKIMRREKLVAARTVLVEDTVANLKSAHALGIRTVWVTQYILSNPHPTPVQGKRTARGSRPCYVDVKVKSIGDLPARLHRLRPAAAIG